jgi:putative FmdB family regulatory protein
MPVYEYYCDECGCRFEEFREVKQRTVCPCPQCSQPARKVFRPVGIIFKGSGFHSTDYRKPDGRERSEGETKKPEPAGASAKEESKDDESGG